MHHANSVTLVDRYHSAADMDEHEPQAPVVVEKLPAKVQAKEGDPVELTVVVQSELEKNKCISFLFFSCVENTTKRKRRSIVY